MGCDYLSWFDFESLRVIMSIFSKNINYMFLMVGILL